MTSGHVWMHRARGGPLARVSLPVEARVRDLQSAQGVCAPVASERSSKSAPQAADVGGIATSSVEAHSLLEPAGRGQPGHREFPLKPDVSREQVGISRKGGQIWFDWRGSCCKSSSRKPFGTCEEIASARHPAPTPSTITMGDRGAPPRALGRRAAGSGEKR
jgi:hypothetical protein